MKTIPVVDAQRLRRRQHPKGRPVDPAARADIAAWLGPDAGPRDRLIEALHEVNDRLGRLPAPHASGSAMTCSPA